MPLIPAFRNQIGRSFTGALGSILDWVESRSPIIRPAFYGALFIWALILVRGAFVVLPILLAIVFVYDRQMFWRFAVTFFFLAPAGGFLGGLLFGLVTPLVRRLGFGGQLIRFTFAAWGYLIVLVYAIMPVLEPKRVVSLNDPWDWAFIGGFGLVIGIAFALGDREAAA